jgi:hypothetical protein
VERKNSLRSLLPLLFATIMVMTGPTSSRAATVKSEVHSKPDGYTVWFVVTSKKGFKPGDTWTLRTDASKVRLPGHSTWRVFHKGDSIRFECEGWVRPPAEAIFVVDGRNIGKIGYSYDIERKSGSGTVEGPCRRQCEPASFDPPSFLGSH